MRRTPTQTAPSGHDPDERGRSARSAGVGCWWLPMRRQQRVDLGDLEPWEAPEDVSQVRVRIDAASAAAHENGVGDRTTPPGVRMADEEPPLPSHGRGAD